MDPDQTEMYGMTDKESKICTATKLNKIQEKAEIQYKETRKLI